MSGNGSDTPKPEPIPQPVSEEKEPAGEAVDAQGGSSQDLEAQLAELARLEAEAQEVRSELERMEARTAELEKKIKGSA